MVLIKCSLVKLLKLFVYKIKNFIKQTVIHALLNTMQKSTHLNKLSRLLSGTWSQKLMFVVFFGRHNLLTHTYLYTNQRYTSKCAQIILYIAC